MVILAFKHEKCIFGVFNGFEDHSIWIEIRDFRPRSRIRDGFEDVFPLYSRWEPSWILHAGVNGAPDVRLDTASETAPWTVSSASKGRETSTRADDFGVSTGFGSRVDFPIFAISAVSTGFGSRVDLAIRLCIRVWSPDLGVLARVHPGVRRNEVRFKR